MSDYQGLDFITDPEHADYLLSIKLGILAGIDMVRTKKNGVGYHD